MAFKAAQECIEQLRDGYRDSLKDYIKLSKETKIIRYVKTSIGYSKSLMRIGPMSQANLRFQTSFIGVATKSKTEIPYNPKLVDEYFSQDDSDDVFAVLAEGNELVENVHEEYPDGSCLYSWEIEDFTPSHEWNLSMQQNFDGMVGAAATRDMFGPGEFQYNDYEQEGDICTVENQTALTADPAKLAENTKESLRAKLDEVFKEAGLTDREKEVYLLVYEGQYSYKQVAKLIFNYRTGKKGLSWGTVKKTLDNVRSKLNKSGAKNKLIEFVESLDT